MTFVAAPEIASMRPEVPVARRDAAWRALHDSPVCKGPNARARPPSSDTREEGTEIVCRCVPRDFAAMRHPFSAILSLHTFDTAD